MDQQQEILLLPIVIHPRYEVLEICIRGVAVFFANSLLYQRRKTLSLGLKHVTVRRNLDKDGLLLDAKFGIGDGSHRVRRVEYNLSTARQIRRGEFVLLGF